MVRHILLDFDYTLVDSSRGILKAFDFALAQLKVANPGVEAITKTIGHSLPLAYAYLTGDEDPQHGIDFENYFLDEQTRSMTAHSTLYDAVSGFIQTAKENKVQLGIVSTKHVEPIHELLHRENIRHHFEVIVGGEHVEAHKPHPHGIHIAMNHLNAEKEQTVFIGDSIYDAGAAQNANVAFIPTLTGETPLEAFEAYPRIGVVKDLSEVFDVVGCKLPISYETNP